MILFETKKELLEFLTFITEGLDKDLKESAFKVDLSITPVSIENLEALQKTFQSYGQRKEKLVQPAKGPLPRATKKK